MSNFLNFWNSRLEWKTKQLNGPGNYREFRETAPVVFCPRARVRLNYARVFHSLHHLFVINLSYIWDRKDRSYSACLLLEWTYFYAFGDELHLCVRWYQPAMLCIRLVPREILWLGELSAELLHHSVKTLPVLDVACWRVFAESALKVHGKFLTF